MRREYSLNTTAIWDALKNAYPEAGFEHDAEIVDVFVRPEIPWWAGPVRVIVERPEQKGQRHIAEIGRAIASLKELISALDEGIKALGDSS